MKIIKRTNHFKPHPLFLPEERMCINIISRQWQQGRQKSHHL